MRIAIYGVGGAGGYFGAQLARAGEEVIFIARGPHLDAIRENGLCLTTALGEMLVQPHFATDDQAEAGIVDVVILGVKANQVTDAAKAIAPMMGGDSFVVPLQNGIEASAQLSSILGEANVVSGLCGTVSWVTAPGHIQSLGDTNFIRFGELDNRRSVRTQKLVDTFDRAGVRAEIPPNIHKAVWEKFLFVVSVGGVAATKRQPIGVIRAEKESRRMLELCMREIYNLARARNVPLEESVIERTLRFVESLPPEGTTSLQRDLEEGRPSELEAWNGAVVRLAREAAVDVPVHAFIYENLLSRELESRANYT